MKRAGKIRLRALATISDHGIIRIRGLSSKRARGTSVKYIVRYNETGSRAHRKYPYAFGRHAIIARGSGVCRTFQFFWSQRDSRRAIFSVMILRKTGVHGLVSE